MRRIARWSSMLGVLLLAAPLAMAQSQAAPTQPAPAGKDYIIGAEDVLEIQVWGSNELNQTVFVRPDGRLSLPLVGELAVAGRTVQQLQDHLLAVYEKTVKGAVVTGHGHRQGDQEPARLLHQRIRQAGRDAAHG